jgi:hypothetical protein
MQEATQGILFILVAAAISCSCQSKKYLYQETCTDGQFLTTLILMETKQAAPTEYFNLTTTQQTRGYNFCEPVTMDAKKGPCGGTPVQTKVADKIWQGS